MSESPAVSLRTGEVVMPTYLPLAPDRNPMFLEKRVYQGSSGRVYPLPFTDRISERPVDRAWQAVWLENEYLEVMILPELGGRVHALRDKTNGYDLIYRQEVIKPALVGLAGPWISGGIEFNWPQHHRPATFLPVDWTVEDHADGSRTVWCGDHDPLSRMKGMHGLCLHPGCARLELKVRVFNRTPWVQTFLWWANVATRVHADYQSFFPPDVHDVADHAKRAMSSFPRCRGVYYGVDYAARGRAAARRRQAAAAEGPVGPGVDRSPDDLSWYAHIPTPCSYMAMGSTRDFFGGYDHRAEAGLVHVADHRIAPGKKQWTWGNHPFGWAWDRNLTDPTLDGEYRPYIELMAGVFTDNQPDFSFLVPGEGRDWSQFWYPIQRVGPVHEANLEAAVRLDLGARRFRLGVAVTRRVSAACIRLERISEGVPQQRESDPEVLAAAEWTADLAPDRPFVLESPQAARPWRAGEVRVRVLDGAGRVLLSYRPARPEARPAPVPAPATEPPAPAAMAGTDELFVTGLHLEQYRHATRCPASYWREALRRDPGDARCNTAMGIWHLRRGEWALAEKHLRTAVERQTRRNPNPPDGEALYHLGLCLRYRAVGVQNPAEAGPLLDQAYDVFYKATWNRAWAGPAFQAIAAIEGLRGEWARARDHAGRSLAVAGGNRGAQMLWVLAMRRLGAGEAAEAVLRSSLATDPLDAWARAVAGQASFLDAQTCLDVAHEYAGIGLWAEAVGVLSGAVASGRTGGDLPTREWGAEPMVAYTLAWLEERRADAPAAARHRQRARLASPDYCFPSRLEDLLVLESALRADPRDARAAYYLGNLLYDRRRHTEAMELWERSASLDPGFSVVWRNLGIGWYNVRRRPTRARAAYDRALQAAPGDARVLYERDQLWKRLRVSPAARLRELARHAHLVGQRDDLTVEWCDLLNHAGRHAEALEVLQARRFQPWEGGEGLALGQHERTHLGLAREATRAGDPASAVRWLEAALKTPHGLGESRHLLSEPVEIRYRLGCALAAVGKVTQARSQWRLAAGLGRGAGKGPPPGETTVASALAARRLGRGAEARRRLEALCEWARTLRRTPAAVDYFATSLPTMLLFEDDLQARQWVRSCFLEAQARWALGQEGRARALLRRVLHLDPAHAGAIDLRRAAEWGEATASREPGRGLPNLSRRGGRSTNKPERKR